MVVGECKTSEERLEAEANERFYIMKGAQVDGDHALMEEQARWLIEYDPSNGYSYVWLGHALAHQTRFEEALAAYELALANRLERDDPNVWESWHHEDLGRLYTKWGKPEKAAEAYRRVAELAPGYVEERLKEAQRWEQEGQFQLALDEIELARMAGGTPDEEFVKSLEEKLAERSPASEG